MRASRVACWICIAAKIITKRNVGVISLCLASKASARGDYFCTTLSSAAELVKIFQPASSLIASHRVRGKSFRPQRSSRLEKKELDVVSATSLLDFLEHTGNRLERREKEREQTLAQFRAAEVFCKVACRRDPQQVERIAPFGAYTYLRRMQKSCSANEIKTFQSTT
jgi:hypothetical protein